MTMHKYVLTFLMSLSLVTSCFAGTGDPVRENKLADVVFTKMLKGDTNTETLSGDKTLTISDLMNQILDPNGSDRDIIFPPEADSTDLRFYVYNAADGSGEDIIAKNDASAEIVTLGPGMGALFICNGTDWVAIGEDGIVYDAQANTVDMGSAEVTTAGAFNSTTVNTGQGDHELYAMDQDVQTTDSPLFSTINLTDITDNNIPKMGASGFEDSVIFEDEGNLGIGTTKPRAGLTLGSTYNETGVELYRTDDETTNYEKLFFNWNSDVAEVGTRSNGTALTRDIRLGVRSLPDGGEINRYLEVQSPMPFFSYQFGGTGLAGSIMEIGGGGNFSSNSNLQIGLTVNPRIIQSGTASYTGLVINPVITSTGSGSNYLANFKVNGTSKFVVDENGNVGIGTTSFGTNAVKAIGIGNGTAPTTSPADMVQIYAEDVASSSELKVRDEAGNITTLSPHSLEWPDDLEVSKKYPRVQIDENAYIGVRRFIAWGKVAELVEELAHREGLLSSDKKIVVYEEIEKRDWQKDEDKFEIEQDAKIKKAKEQKKALETEITALGTEIDTLEKEITDIDSEISEMADSDEKDAKLKSKEEKLKVKEEKLKIIAEKEEQRGNIKIPRPYERREMVNWLKALAAEKEAK